MKLTVNTHAAPQNQDGRMVALGVGLFVLGFVSGWWCVPLPSRNSAEKGRVARADAAASSGADFLRTEPRAESSEPADFFSRLHVALSIGNREKRARAFSAIADDLNAAQLQDAVTRLAKLRIPDREEVMAQLFARWAELDPVAAMMAAQGLSNVAERQRAVSAVLGAWVEKDPAAAEQSVIELPEGPLKNSAWETLIGAIAVSDPPHALALAQGLQLSWEAAEKMAAAIFDTWIGNNPQEAAAHAEQLPPGPLRSSARWRVASQWARINLPQALAWADALPDQEFKVRSSTDDETEAFPICSVLKNWVEKDSAAAVRWLQQLPEGNKKAALTLNARTFLRFAEPTPQVVTQLVMMMPEGSMRDYALQEFAQEIARQEPAAAIEWLRGQSDPTQRKMILRGLLSSLSGSDLQRALQFVPAVDASGKEEPIVIQALEGGGMGDPATLADWAIRQPNNQQYLNRIAASWGDADRAAAWLQTLPAPARDEAVRAIVDQKLRRVNGGSGWETAGLLQNAERWIVQLSSEQARQSSYEKLAERWLSIDADSARTWMNTSPLPSDVKERLLELQP